MARTAFVTGGTGFVGINLIELLVDEGWEVTALHRASSNLEYLKRFPIDTVKIDRSVVQRLQTSRWPIAEKRGGTPRWGPKRWKIF